MSDARLPDVRLADADFLTDRLLTGGDLDGWDDLRARRQLAELVGLGVTHLVDVRSEADDSDLVAEVAPEVSYLHAGQDDAGQQMPDAWFDTVVDHTLEALASQDTRVLLHCHAGINRGPSAAYAVLLTLGHDPVEAMELMRSRRPVVFAAYALDALDWHLRRQGVTGRAARTARGRLRSWRRAHLPRHAPRLLADGSGS